MIEDDFRHDSVYRYVQKKKKKREKELTNKIRISYILRSFLEMKNGCSSMEVGIIWKEYYLHDAHMNLCRTGLCQNWLFPIEMFEVCLRISTKTSEDEKIGMMGNILPTWH